LFFCGWLIMSYFFEGPPENNLEAFKMNYSVPVNDDIEPPKTIQGITSLKLEQFIIPLHNPQQEASFLSVVILLHLNNVDEEEILKETKNIRSAIYNLLLQKEVGSILDSKKRGDVITELQYHINHIFNRQVVTEINFRDLLMV